MVKFKYRDTDKIYFVSDLHFGHCNIIKYCNRPFNNVSEMDETLISNWNTVVEPDATVFCLGDFSFYGSGKTSEIISRLNGHIILIKGNHDHFQDTILDKFEAVYPQLHIEIGNRSVYLNHYPFLTYAGMYRKQPVIQLFGHIHSGPRSIDGKDTTRLDMTSPYQLEVGVDNFNYTPISWNQVKEAIQWQVEHKKIYAKRLQKDSLIKKLWKQIINGKSR